MLHELLPDDGEVAGLLALMLLTDARRAARTGPNGELIPLAEQDRALWNRASIDEGVALDHATRWPRDRSARTRCKLRSRRCTTRRPPMPTPTGCRSSCCTNCSHRISPNPMVTLNRAVAVAMVEGPRRRSRPLEACSTMTNARSDHHRLEAVRAHLLEMAGDDERAIASYRLAARRAMSRPEQRYLDGRAATLSRRLR